LGNLTLFSPGIFVLNQAGVLVNFGFALTDNSASVVGLNGVIARTTRQQGGKKRWQMPKDSLFS